MPPLTNEEALKPLRVLAYGPPKAKKTWWAGKAAEAGFNVLVIDGDDGSHILQNISEEAKQRIHVVDAVDTMTKSVMAFFMVHLLKGKPFVWDEQSKERVLAKANPEHSHYYIDVSKLTSNDVIVIDSWTKLSWSVAMRYSSENNIDLSNANKTEWEGYRWCGSLLNWMLSNMHDLKCHVIVVGHQDSYEKKKSDGKTTDWQRMQVKSISGPHAMQIAKDFSDVLFFRIIGSSFRIDATVEKDRDGGSRNLEPKLYNWDELQFGDLFKAAGNPANKITPAAFEAVKYFNAGEPVEVEGLSLNSGASNTLQATTASAPKTGAKLSNLLGKK